MEAQGGVVEVAVELALPVLICLPSRVDVRVNRASFFTFQPDDRVGVPLHPHIRHAVVGTEFQRSVAPLDVGVNDVPAVTVGGINRTCLAVGKHAATDGVVVRLASNALTYGLDTYIAVVKHAAGNVGVVAAARKLYGDIEVREKAVGDGVGVGVEHLDAFERGRVYYVFIRPHHKTLEAAAVEASSPICAHGAVSRVDNEVSVYAYQKACPPAWVLACSLDADFPAARVIDNLIRGLMTDENVFWHIIRICSNNECTTGEG